MANSTKIANVSAQVVQAPAPNNLQQRGVIVTQGGTRTTPGTATPVGKMADVQNLLASPLPILSLAWAAGVVTVTTTNPHQWNNADVVPVVISGAAPIAYNGKFTATVTGPNTFTYPLATNPGVATSVGSVILWAVTELTQMATTYFAGVGVPSIWVLELGEGQVPAGVTALEAHVNSVQDTPSQKYIYEVPREWASDSSYQAMTNNYITPESMVYFWTTLSSAAQAAAYQQAKSVFAIVEAPNVATTEFSISSPLGTVLSQNPSVNNKVPPLQYSPSYGTTSYPLEGNQSVLQSLSVVNVGWIGTGAEGGISNNILFQGKLLSGLGWNFWYSTDWVQVQSALALANEVINGSATSINPLYYEQDGVDRLQNRVIQVFNQGVQYGLGNGQVQATKLPTQQFLQNYNANLYAGQLVVNAEPFLTYAANNPSDYGLGRYAGLTGIWIPKGGFLQVFFNIQATTLIVTS